MTETVAAVIVTFNGAAWIERCLSSLLEGSLVPRICVVDNCSSDDTAALVKAKFPQVRLIRSARNLGFGVGNNLGLARELADGADYLLLLNQDAYVLPATVDGMLRFMQAEPTVGVASPLHCSLDASNIDRKTYLGYLAHGAPELLCDAVLGRAQPFYRIRGINAAAWFMRASTLRKVGGFDPLFFMYGEDDDLIARLAWHGVAFALLPSQRIVHLRQSPPRPPPRGWWDDVARRAARSESQLLVRVKHPEHSQAHRILLLLAHGIVEPLPELLIERDLREYLGHLRASWRVLRKLPTVARHARLAAGAGPHFLPPAVPEHAA